jgi:hypothetical protein
MLDPTLQDAILHQVGQLPLEQQKLVLGYAQSLAHQAPRGVPGVTLLRFAGVLNAAAAADMTREIQLGCEQVDEHAW